MVRVHPVPASPDTPGSSGGVHVHPLPVGVIIALVFYGVLSGVTGVAVVSLILGQDEQLAAVRAETAAEFDRRTAARDALDAKDEAARQVEREQTRIATCVVLTELNPTPAVQDLATRLGCPVAPGTGEAMTPGGERSTPQEQRDAAATPGRGPMGPAGPPGADGQDAPSQSQGGSGGSDPDPDPAPSERPPPPPPPQECTVRVGPLCVEEPRGA